MMRAPRWLVLLLLGGGLAVLPVAASEVRLAGEVFRPGVDPAVVAVALERTPGPRGELRAVTVDWRVDGGPLPAEGAVFTATSGRVRMGRGQRAATVELRLRPEVLDAPRRFARFAVTRVRGGALGAPAAADLEVGGPAIDEEVYLGPGGRPHVAALADGGALVTWESEGWVRVGRFDANGRLVRPGITPVRQRDPACCSLEPRVFADADGGFVLAWHDGDGDRRGLFAQRFDATDRATTGVFALPSETLREQLFPRIDFLPDGGFLASFGETDIWAAIPYQGTELAVRVFAADGTPRGPQHSIGPPGVPGWSLRAVQPLAAGGFLLAAQRFVRRIGTFYSLHHLDADGAPVATVGLEGAEGLAEIAPTDHGSGGPGGYHVLGCQGGRWVLWAASADGAVLPVPDTYRNGVVSCGRPATLLPGRPGVLGLFAGDGSSPEPPVAWSRANPQGTGWELLRLAQTRCLNAGTCDWDHGNTAGAIDRQRDTVSLAWDTRDGVWFRRFPDHLAATIYPAPAGPRTAPGELASIPIRLSGDLEAATLRFATRDGTARAGFDYEATAGELVVSREQGTSLPIRILDPAGVTADTSFRLTLAAVDARVAVATPRRPTVSVIRNTVCNQLAPALCLLRGAVEVQARYHGTDGFERNATPLLLNERNGLLRYGEPASAAVPEVAVKVMGSRARPTLYWGSVAERPTALQVGDDIDGRFGWVDDPGTGAEACGAGILPDPYVRVFAAGGFTERITAAPGPCAVGLGELCLLGGRYAVAGSWENPWDGSHGEVFWFPHADTVGVGSFDGVLVETLVRLEPRGNGLLFVAAPLTDFPLRLTVRDTASGEAWAVTQPRGPRCRSWELLER
jgi:hypothetical protein